MQQPKHSEATSLYPNNIGWWIKKQGYTQEEVADEIGIARRTLSNYIAGKRVAPRYCLEKIAKTIGCEIEELTFPSEHQSSPSLRKVSESQQEIVSAQHRDNSTSIYPTQLLGPHGVPLQISVHIHQQTATPTTIYLEKDAIIDDRTTNTSGQEHPSRVEDTVNRRKFLRSTAATVMADDLLIAELLDRFSLALKKPSTIDARFLNYLEARTGSFWQDRHGAILASRDLFSYVVEHFEKLVKLLESSLLPAERTRLCDIAGKTALLLGELLLDMSYYAQAREFQSRAITAAQEADTHHLEAISWGRLSLAWTYSEEARNALTCVQKARYLATSNDPLTNAWLAAIEAEAQVNQHDYDACLKALDEATSIEDQHHASEDNYLIHFDWSLLEGYQGVCYRKLYRPDDAQSIIYLEKAQKVLMDALARLDAQRIQRKPTFLTDLADTYLRQGEIEEACEQAIQAVQIAEQMKLQKVVRRLFKLRQELEAWKDTQYVKNLDKHLAPLTASGGKH